MQKMAILREKCIASNMNDNGSLQFEKKSWIKTQTGVKPNDEKKNSELNLLIKYRLNFFLSMNFFAFQITRGKIKIW